MSGANWGDTDWQEGKRGWEGLWGEAGREFSQSQLFSNWVEWLRGIGRSWVFCVQAAETFERSSWNPPCFYTPECLFLQLFRSNLPWAITVLPFSLPLYLAPFVYLSLRLSIRLCPIDHRLGPKARQPVKAEGFELLFQTKPQYQSTEETKVMRDGRQRERRRGGERGNEGESWALVAMLTSCDIQLSICHF